MLDFVRRSRLAVLWWPALAVLAMSSCLRVGLLFWAQGQAGLDLPVVFGALLVGAVYDLAFLVFATVPLGVFLLSWPQRWWQHKVTGAMLTLVCAVWLFTMAFTLVAELLFWEEFGVRFNFIAVDYLIYRREVTNNILESYPVFWLVAGLVLVALLLTRICTRHLRQQREVVEPLGHRLSTLVVWGLLVLGLGLFLGQGPRNSLDNSFAKEIASSGPYQFFAAFRNNTLDYRQFYLTVPDATALADLRGELAESAGHSGTNAAAGQDAGIWRDVVTPGPDRGYNVMLVLVESLSAEYLARFGNSEGLTPNLDALIDDSLFFSKLYATGTRTTRGLEAVTLSMPPTPGRSIVKRIGQESGLWSIGNVLKDQGYDTRFIYGGRGYFDNMNAFFQGNGYSVMDQASVPEDQITFSNAWGMSDENLFDVALAAADDSFQQGQPFFFQVLTTSNHRPYTYPEGRIDIPSGTNRAGAVKYSDHALGELLRNARNHPWFANTVFVIVADHCAGSAGKVSLPLERYHIPMWIYAPGLVEPGEIKRLVSQIDIAPTLLGLLGVDYRSSAFGEDVLLAPRRQDAVVGNYQYLGYLNDDQLTILQPQKQIERFDYVGGEARPDAGASEQSAGNLVLTQAYYQSASLVFEQRLNAWERRGQMAPPVAAVAAAAEPAQPAP